MTSLIPPASYVETTYGNDLRALGATSLRQTGFDTLEVDFGSNGIGYLVASQALRDTVTGAQLVLKVSGNLPAFMPGTPHVAKALQALEGVVETAPFEGSGPRGEPVPHLGVFTSTAQRATDLARLLSPQLADGTRVVTDQARTHEPMG